MNSRESTIWVLEDLFFNLMTEQPPKNEDSLRTPEKIEEAFEQLIQQCLNELREKLPNLQDRALAADRIGAQLKISARNWQTAVDRQSESK